MRGSLSALVLLALASSCTRTPTWETDVRPLMAGSCQGCHVEGGIAPFALTTYEQAVAMKDDIVAATKNRTMPPYLAGPNCAEYADDQRLSDEQIAMLENWAKGGTPKGTPDPKIAIPEAPSNSLPRVDLQISMPQTYTPTKSPDDYRCFVIDWPAQVDQYVTGFNVMPGNPRVVHHVIAFLIPPEKTQAIVDLDAADPAEGYTCFGGPGGNPVGISWLGSWAPGGMARMYPEDTGILARPGSKVVMQVHYNTSAAPEGERDDLTRIEIALADSVKKRAFLMPWADPDWVRMHQMPILANAKDTEHSFALDPTQYMSYLTQNQLPNGTGFRVYAAALHQHLLGTSSRLQINRADGTSECLLDIPRWDFHWQRSYRLSQTKIFHPNDLLQVSCHWDNSAEAQPIVGGVKQETRDVNWGEGTTDEMCLGLVYISE
ncbi:MAG: hypothetical protein U0228_38715 [Myxococcaceae bacterium]